MSDNAQGDGAPTFSATKLLREITKASADAAPLAGKPSALVGLSVQDLGVRVEGVGLKV